MSLEQLDSLIRHMHRTLGLQETGTLTDQHLLERFVRERDEAAFEVLVWRHGNLVWNVCRRVLRHRQDAEDAFQATFLALVRKADSIGNREALGSWLYKVAYRVALRARAGVVRRATHVQPLVEEPAVAAGEEAEWRDVAAVLDEEVERLPAKYRGPFVLCQLEGQTIQEVARQLGLPSGTIGTRVARAKKLLQTRLIRRGLTLPAGGLAMLWAPPAEAAAVSMVLVEATVKAALLFGVNPTAALAGPVITLAEGVLRTMWWTKWKMLAVLFLIVGLVGGGGGWAAYQVSAADPGALAADKDTGTPPGQKPADALPKPVQAKSQAAKQDPAVSEKEQRAAAIARAKVQRDYLEEQFGEEEAKRRYELTELRMQLLALEQRRRDLESAQVGNEWQDHVAAIQKHQGMLGESKQRLNQIRSAVGKDTELFKKSQQEEEAIQKKANDEIARAKERWLAFFKKNQDQIMTVRREILRLENRIGFAEWQQTMRRGRYQAQLDALEDRIRRLQESDLPIASPRDRSLELERKVEQLIREVREMRRELRQRPAEKSRPEASRGGSSR